jgi:hypothetical protein
MRLAAAQKVAMETVEITNIEAEEDPTFSGSIHKVIQVGAIDHVGCEGAYDINAAKPESLDEISIRGVLIEVEAKLHAPLTCAR